MKIRNAAWWLPITIISGAIALSATERTPSVENSVIAADPQVIAPDLATAPRQLGEELVRAEALLTEPPLVVGPTARVIEPQSGLPLLARVDTGASVTSLHCTENDFVIEQASEDPFENVGKPIRLRLENTAGASSWIETEVLDYVEVRSANGAEHRYRVRIPLKLGPVHKETIVNLNDRSRMTYRLLLGRDFLAGHFVVDVSQPGVQAL